MSSLSVHNIFVLFSKRVMLLSCARTSKDADEKPIANVQLHMSFLAVFMHSAILHVDVDSRYLLVHLGKVF